MRIVINTNDIDVNLTEAECAKLAGDDGHQHLLKCINLVLADISLPAIGAKDFNVVREGLIVDDAPNHYRLCYNYVHPMSASLDIMLINDICRVTNEEGATVLHTPCGVDLHLNVNKSDSCYSLSNIIYRKHCAEYDLEVEVTFGEKCIDLYRESFMRMILDMDADAAVMGANTVFSRVIKLESIDVGVVVYDNMFTEYPPKVIVFNAPPVCVNYSGRGFFIKHMAFATVGRYNIFIGKDNVGIGYCYAPGYIRMEESFHADTPIIANNIVQLEQCMSITGAVNEKVVANGPATTEVIDQVNWYAANAFYESTSVNDSINSKIARAVACAESYINDFIGGAPGYDRLYNIFSEIERFKASSSDFNISNGDVIELLCNGFAFKCALLDNRGAEFQKERKLSMISDALKTLNLRALSEADVAEAYYYVLEQILPLEERGMEMVDVLTGLLHVMVDVGVCSPFVIQHAIDELDEFITIRHRRNSRRDHRDDDRRDRRGDRRGWHNDRRNSPRDLFESRFRDGLRAQGLRIAFEEAMENVHFDKSASDRLYRSLFVDIESIVAEHEGTIRISEVGNIIAYTLNKYNGSNPYVVQCGNKTLDCIISDLVKLNSDKLSAGDMLEFINPAGVRDVISKIDTYVDELRAYIVEDGKVHL